MEACSWGPGYAEMIAKHGTTACDSRRAEPADGNYPCFDEFWDYYPGTGCIEADDARGSAAFHAHYRAMHEVSK